jgi:hypothetical protein
MTISTFLRSGYYHIASYRSRGKLARCIKLCQKSLGVVGAGYLWRRGISGHGFTLLYASMDGHMLEKKCPDLDICSLVDDSLHTVYDDTKIERYHFT